MKKFTFGFKVVLSSGLIAVLMAFSVSEPLEEQVDFLQRTFTDHYDSTQDINKIKRYELNVTNNGFCRYRRYYNTGKVEYFAFKLSKFKAMDYSGTQNSGRLILHTKNDDVIVQTYKDKDGDVDTMSTFVVIPVKNIEPEDLNTVRETLTKISNAVQAP